MVEYKESQFHEMPAAAASTADGAAPRRASRDAFAAPAEAPGLDEDKIRVIRAHVRRHAVADDRRAWAVLAWTALGQALVFALYLAGWTWPALLLGAAVTVRTFIIFHDAIHYSFFARRAWNERLATVLQVFVLTPVKSWRAHHVRHHAHFGDLHFHDVADTIFLTREGFDALPPWRRAALRVARTPVVFFSVLPLLLWLVEYPLRYGNAWIWSALALHAGFVWNVSPWHAGALWLGMVTGVLLFHLQHGIGPGYRAPRGAWRFEHAALLGSTWVPVRWPLSVFTLGIEFHHIHHLHPGVPCYALARCHREAPPAAWSEVTVGTGRKCLAALRNVMWDAALGRLTPFPPLKRSPEEPDS